MIQFSKPDIGEEEIEAVNRVLRSGWLAAGPETKAFEEEFSEYISPDGEHYYCIFTNSCTSALKMAFNILKVIGFQGIYYPLNTFVATYSAAAELGLAICSKGGYDGDIWRITPSLSAQSVVSDLKIDTTASVGDFVPLSAIERQEKGSEYLKEQSLNQDTELVNQPNLKRHQGLSTQSNQDIGLHTNGSNENTVRQMSAMSVDQLKELVGQIKITDIPANVINGRNYALNATTNTMYARMASTVVHYGSTRDNSPCLIEDSAHRIEQNDILTGLIRCYSFYATKNLTTGSGGMFVTANKEIYELAKLYWKDGLSTSTEDRLNGIQGYSVKSLVSGYDGNDIAAALGRVQLRRLPEFTKRRNDIRDYYNRNLGQEWQGNHLYPYFVADEASAYQMISEMKEEGIACGHHYPGTGWNGVSLPIYPLLTDSEVETVVAAVKSYAQRV